MQSFESLEARRWVEITPDKQVPITPRSVPVTPARPAPPIDVSTQELEERLISTVLSLEASGRLQVELQGPAQRYRQMQRELVTHKRGALILSHDEYAEVRASYALVRSQIIEYCLRTNCI